MDVSKKKKTGISSTGISRLPNDVGLNGRRRTRFGLPFAATTAAFVAAEMALATQWSTASDAVRAAVAATTVVDASSSPCASMPYALGCFYVDPNANGALPPIEIVVAMMVVACAYVAVVSSAVDADELQEEEEEGGHGAGVEAHSWRGEPVTYRFARSTRDARRGSSPMTDARVRLAMEAKARRRQRKQRGETSEDEEMIPAFVRAVLPPRHCPDPAAAEGVKRVPSGLKNNVVMFKFPESRPSRRRAAKNTDDEDDDEEQGGAGGGGSGKGSSRGALSSMFRHKSGSTTRRGGDKMDSTSMSMALLLCLSLVDDAAALAAPYFLSHAHWVAK